MVINNYCPFTDEVLLNIVFNKVEIPAIKKKLIECLTILSNEWYMEQHTQKYFDAGNVITDFRNRNHI
jgi:hypothetical protein